MLELICGVCVQGLSQVEESSMASMEDGDEDADLSDGEEEFIRKRRMAYDRYEQRADEEDALSSEDDSNDDQEEEGEDEDDSSEEEEEDEME